LSNYWAVHEGFVYHGHNGGVEGGLTDMSYLKEYGVGYFYSINAGNGDSFQKIGKAIRAYITRDLQKPALPAVATLPANVNEYAGWYQPDSPRVELLHFLERLLGLSTVRFENGKLMLSSLGEKNQEHVPVTSTQFRAVPKKDLPEPAPTVALLSVNSEGRFIQIGSGTFTMKQVPAWFAISEILLTGWFVVAVVLVLLYAPFWILGGLSQKRRRPAERGIRRWPLVAVLSLIAVVLIFTLSNEDLITRLGNLTVWSGALFLATVLFGLATFASCLALARANKQEVRAGVRGFSVFVIVALLIAAVYLAYWGIIGIRMWA
jgi:hypothetical protein